MVQSRQIENVVKMAGWYDDDAYDRDRDQAQERGHYRTPSPPSRLPAKPQPSRNDEEAASKLRAQYLEAVQFNVQKSYWEAMKALAMAAKMKHGKVFDPENVAKGDLADIYRLIETPKFMEASFTKTSVGQMSQGLPEVGFKLLEEAHELWQDIRSKSQTLYNLSGLSFQKGLDYDALVSIRGTDIKLTPAGKALLVKFIEKADDVLSKGN